MPKIIELMSHRADQVAPDASLGDVARLMLGTNISAVIVVENEVVCGIVTERDVLHAMRQHSAPAMPVHQVMTAPVHCVSADMDFRVAYHAAASLGIRHLVVVDAEGHPVGVATETDFRRHLGLDFFRQINNVDTLMERSFPQLSATARLDEALSAMEAVRASCALVVDHRRPVGIVTERDVVRFYLGGENNPELGSIMTQPVACVQQDMPLAEAAQQMLESRIRHLAVLDRSGCLVGLLTEHTLMRPLEFDLVDDALAERLQLTHSRDAAEQRSRLNERYQRALLDNFPFLVWLKDTESRFLAVNRPFAKAAGLPSPEAVLGKTDFDLWPADLAARYRADDVAVMDSLQQKTGEELRLDQALRSWFETYKAPVIGDDGTVFGTVGFSREISGKKRAEEALLLRNEALAGLIRGEALSEVLERIVRSVEAETPEWICSIMLLDESGCRLRQGASPGLPEEYRAAVDGLAIGDAVGSCGTAAFCRQRVIVEDVFSHPYWAAYRDLARRAGFAACWSEPILGPQGELLGTFAAYHATPAVPGADDLEVLAQASQLAALVLSHQRGVTRLRDSLDTFRGIFDSIDEALFIQVEDGSFLDVNAGTEKMFGYPRQALVGQTQAFLAAPGLNDPTQVYACISAAMAGLPQHFEYWAKSASGRIFPVEVHLHAGHYFGRRALIAAVQDIAERKYASRLLAIEKDLAEALVKGVSRQELLPLILDAALRFPELDVGAVYWRQPDGGYQLLAAEGLAPAMLARIGDYAASSPQAALVCSGELLCSGSESAEAGLIENPWLPVDGLHCLAVLPLVVGGEVMACLSLGGSKATRISRGTAQALEILAGHFAQTLLRLDALEEATRLQQNLSGLFDTLQDFLFVVDADGTILHCNSAVANHLGYQPAQLKGRPIATVYPENTRKMAWEHFREIIDGRRSICPLPLQRVDGSEVMVETRFVHGHWDGRAALFGVAQDITERLLAEERQKLAASVFENAHEGIMITDPQGRIVEVNSTFSELTGYSREEAIGESARLLKSGHHPEEFYGAMWQTIQDTGYWRGEVWNRKKGGEVFVELLTISAVRDRQAAISHFVGIFSDITVIKENQSRLEHLAHYDALTQLPNRMLLADRLQLAMAQTERSGKVLAVCYLDLDGFKQVNDDLGHATGDQLLVEVAQRLKLCVRAGDTVARLGGDEFVLLFSGLEDVHECDHAVSRIVVALASPFALLGDQLAISASVGVTLYPTDGADADTLLRHADQAMYAAKQSGRNRYHLFDPESDRRARDRRDQVGRIHQALAAQEFLLYFQPKVDMRQGIVLGAEALIRWQHPERGLLLPGEFLPVIEGSDFAVELGNWVLRRALAQLNVWQQAGLDVCLSVNIAGNHLQAPNFVPELIRLLAEYPSLQPQQLELEVLETTALEDMIQVARVFAECRKLGVRFALDDFGTGYSSLTYFRRLPADVLKIDQSFVRDMLDDPDDLAIVEGVIGLTHAFRRKVIAEGVETPEHGMVLLQLGCDHAQGFGIARPMPGPAFPNWVANFQPDPLWSSIASFQWSREDLPMLIAEVDHARWKASLYAYLADTEGSLPAPACDHRECRFGRWYYGIARQRYAHLGGYAAIAEVHVRIHELGNAMMALRGADADREPMAGMQRELEALSLILIDCVQTIQTEVLLSGPLASQSSRR